MFKDIEESASQEMDKQVKYSIEQDKLFNRYIILGCAASLTLIVNLMAKNPKLFDDSEYMGLALWSFATAIVLNASCVFINARLADVEILRAVKIKAFLIAQKNEAEGSSTVGTERLNKISDLANEKGTLSQVGRKCVLFCEAFSGIVFCVGIFVSIFELTKLL